MYVREVNLSKDKATNEEKRSTISYWLVFFAGTGVEYSLSLDNMKSDKSAMIKKMHNQKQIPTTKTEVGTKQN